MFILVLFILILFPYEAQEGAREGLKVAFETVIPSILPFSAVAGALVYSGMAERLGQRLLPVARLMRISPCGLTALVTGFLGGYPTGCRMVCDMYKEGFIEKEEGEKILCYANNGGLVFALNICGGQAFGGRGAGWRVFAVSVISALITALVYGRGEAVEKVAPKKEKLPFMAAVGKGIASGGGVILNVVSSFVVFYAVARALQLGKMPLLEGIVEMTKGITYAGSVNSLPLAAFFFSIGGAGVFAQSAAICSECNLSLKGYVKGKVLSSVISFLITYLTVNRPFFGKEIAVFSLCAISAVIIAVKVMKKLYASA